MTQSARVPIWLTALAGFLAAAPAARATWSIIVCDTSTGEVGIASATCVSNINLAGVLPVVLVGKGAGACQSFGDFDGIRRPVIFNGLVNGTDPAVILTQLAAITGHQDRQYGIVDTLGRKITFTGTGNGQHASGVVGSVGTLHYAIQGNILTGACVISETQNALVNTIDDIPDRLMAAMQAARGRGGDGRCSCSPAAPTSCGCPPASFNKSAHTGFMIVARIGDTDDALCSVSGCADGSYYMRLNVANQSVLAADPVVQLQNQYNTFRNNLIGVADAVHSLVSFQDDVLPPDGASATLMLVNLRDHADGGVTTGSLVMSVTHAPGSAGRSTIGAPNNLGGGQFSVPLTAGTAAGIDRFRITVTGGPRPVTLMPDAGYPYFAYGDMDCTGAVGAPDVGPFVQALLDPVGYAAAHPNCLALLADVNGSGTVDADDIMPFVDLVAGP